MVHLHRYTSWKPCDVDRITDDYEKEHSNTVSPAIQQRRLNGKKNKYLSLFYI